MVDPARPVRAAGAFLRRGVALGLVLLAASPALAGKKKDVPPPALTREHPHPTGGFTVRTPESWTAETAADDPDALVTQGDGMIVRFVYRQGEVGLDSLHVSCMVERLTPLMDVQPNVQYEYDFIGGVVLEHRALDSAFVVRYDKPIDGETVWRQRNVTLVGAGRSLCVVTHTPLSTWKKSAEVRRLAEAVMQSLTFP